MAWELDCLKERDIGRTLTFKKSRENGKLDDQQSGGMWSKNYGNWWMDGWRRKPEERAEWKRLVGAIKFCNSL